MFKDTTSLVSKNSALLPAVAYPSKRASAARSNALPDIPTVDEFLPGYEATA
jgi:hypothetical protein